MSKMKLEITYLTIYSSPHKWTRLKIQVRILTGSNMLRAYLASLSKVLQTAIAHIGPAVIGNRQTYLEWWGKWMIRQPGLHALQWCGASASFWVEAMELRVCMLSGQHLDEI